MKKKLPIYEFLIDETSETGVKTISIVADPAFGSRAVFFEKSKPKFIALGDVKKQIIAGLALIPDVLVFRVDPETGEQYNAFFSAQTIEQIVNRFHDEQNGKNVNLNHDEKLPVNAYLLEDYIVNSQARVDDLKAKGIEHSNIMGAWYVAYKVKSPEVFNSIINGGEQVGFSVESFLDKVLTTFNTEIKNKFINEQIKLKMTKINKTIKEKILAIFTEVENFQRALVPELAFDIEWAKKDEPVNKVVVDENGNESLQPVGQGEFTTEKGIVVVDAASNLVEVRPLPKEPKVPETSGSTSGTTSGETTQVSGATAIVNDQPAAAKVQVPEVTGVTSGDTGNMETYPWEQCVADQTKRYGSKTAAERVCGYIRSKNMSADDLSEQELKELLGADFKSGSTSGASGSTSGATSSKNGLNKSISELCPVAGDYIIQVCVDDTGTITEATVTSQKDLLPQSQDAMPSGMSSNFSTQVKTAFARVIELEANVAELEKKMKEPISEPILAPEKKVLTQTEFNKLTPFEKIKYNKGW